ncbi:MAG: hypothetical protein HY719_08750 [Planctomycetes bacterium]|nr:hypothetical protein [Planctomycetota bacterium]
MTIRRASLVFAFALLALAGGAPARRAEAQQAVTITPRTAASGAQALELQIVSETGDLFSFTSSELPRLDFGGGVTVSAFSIDSPKFARAVVNVPAKTLGSMEVLITVKDEGAAARTGRAALAVTGPVTQGPATVSLSDVPVVQINTQALQNAADVTLTGALSGDLLFSLPAGVTITQANAPKVASLTSGVKVSAVVVPASGTSFSVTVSNAGGLTATLTVTNLRLDASRFSSLGGTEGELLVTLAAGASQAPASIPVAVTPAGSVKAGTPAPTTQTPANTTQPTTQQQQSTGNTATPSSTGGGGGGGSSTDFQRQARRAERERQRREAERLRQQESIGRQASAPLPIASGGGQQRPAIQPPGQIPPAQAPAPVDMGQPQGDSARAAPPPTPIAGAPGSVDAGGKSELLTDRVRVRSRRALALVRLAVVGEAGEPLPFVGLARDGAGQALPRLVRVEMVLRDDPTTGVDVIPVEVFFPGAAAPVKVELRETEPTSARFRSEPLAVIVPDEKGAK